MHVPRRFVAHRIRPKTYKPLIFKRMRVPRPAVPLSGADRPMQKNHMPPADSGVFAARWDYGSGDKVAKVLDFIKAVC